MTWQKDEFVISTDKALLNVEYIHAWLSQHSYWAAGIPLETVHRSIQGALCFGIYTHNQQVGFARVITDAATFGYLADVFIDERLRGRGLGKWLIAVIMDHPDLQGLRRFMLATRDAHELYRQYGFTGIGQPERLMQIVRPDVYKKKSEV